MAANWALQINVAGDSTVYSYPDGPLLPNHTVIRTPGGDYLVTRGNALLDVHNPADVAQVTHLGQHHVKVVDNGSVLLDADLETHFWNCCYEVRPNGFTVKKTPKQVYDAHLLPIYGNTGNRTDPTGFSPFVPPWDPSLKAHLLWSTSSVTKYMPTTGERPDIGMITDWLADYLLRGKPEAMLAIAQAAGGFPFHWSDLKTGLPPNIIQYPGVNSYDMEDRQGAPLGLPSPYVIKGPKVNGYFMWGNDAVPQNAHFCDMTYGAAIVFEDAIFLLYTQRAATFNLGVSAELFTKSGARVQGGEIRGVCHGLGMLIKARAATIDAKTKGYFVPGMHFDVDYWDALIANQVEFYGQKLSLPSVARFNTITDMTTFAPWQHEFGSMNSCLAMLTGKVEWTPIFLNMVKNTVARFKGGKDSWPPAWGGYYVDLQKKDGTLYANWGEVFDGFYIAGQTDPSLGAPTTAQYNALKADGMNGGKMLGTTEQVMTSHAVFEFCAYLESEGKAQVRANIPDFDVARANCEVLFRGLNACNPRVSVTAKYDPTGAPPPPPVYIPPVVTPPPVTPNPPTEISLPQTATLKPGDNKLLPLIVTPANGDLSTLVYKSANEAVVAVMKNEKGVMLKYIGPGTANVLADVNGADETGAPAIVEAVCAVTCEAPALPLVHRLEFGPLAS